MLIFLYLRGSEVKIFTAEGFVNHVTSSREDLCSGTHKLVSWVPNSQGPMKPHKQPQGSARRHNQQGEGSGEIASIGSRGGSFLLFRSEEHTSELQSL